MMKKILIPFMMLALFSFITADSKLSKEDRKMAKTELKKSGKHLNSVVKGLSAAQLNFKSSPESWSIAEVTEHLAISETNIFGMLQGTLKTPADPSKRSDVKMTDQQILSMMVDRSNKIKTREAFEPTGKWGSHEATLAEFKAKRKSNLNYVRTTKDDLRNRYQQMPFGTMDAYQILLFMSAHTERHILQIEEVKADPNFPKS